MPNWVKTIVHAVNEKVDFTKFTNDDGDFTFEKVIPMPEDIYREDLGERERQQYGSRNWYDWSIENWGTKWDACDVNTEKRTVIFNTAWDFALPVIRELAKMVGDLLCFYADEDIGCNCGALFIRADGSLKEIDANIVFAECVWGDLDLEDRIDCVKRFDYLFD